MPPGARGPHDAGPDRAENRIALLLGGPRKGRGGRDARDVALDARADGDGRLDEPALTERADSVREGEREGTAGHLHVRDSPTLAEPGGGRGDLAVQGAADHRQASQ